MKKVKIVDYTKKGKKVRYEYLNLTKWQIFKLKTKKFLKKLAKIIIIILIAWIIYKVGSLKQAEIVEVEVKVEPQLAMLTKIAKCESGNTHFDKNGQVLLRGNTNKTVDIGRYQINSYYWGAKAKELGLDLTKEKDNETMAKYIFTNFGSDSWSATRKCWSK